MQKVTLVYTNNYLSSWFISWEITDY